MIAKAVRAPPLGLNVKPQSQIHSMQQTYFSIATAEVDPEYLLSFKSKTVSVPEFEEFIRQYNDDTSGAKVALVGRYVVDRMS